MRFLTIDSLGQFIDVHSRLNTTAETLKFIRRHHTDGFIQDSLEHCSIGNKLALQQLLGKVYTEGVYSTEDRLELDYKDILETE